MLKLLPRLALFTLIAGAIPAALPSSALAQAPGGRDDCILDNCRDRQPGGTQRDPDRPFGRDRFQDQPRNERQAERPGDRGGGGERYGSRPGEFDFYVLALSWSPSFCGSDAGRRSREQCAIGARNAFVVHGLWPQFERGFPSYCDDRQAPRFSLEQARGVWPEEGLARYQWRKHGSCSGLSPSDYFSAGRRARDMVVIPEEFRSPNQPGNKDPKDIERAFIEANRTLRPGMIAVTCTRRGQLEEVRVCLSKDLRSFRACPEVTRQACRTDNVNIPAPR